MTSTNKRLAAIEALPDQMQDDALVDWPTVAALCGFKDIEYTRHIVTKAGVPLVELSERRRMPRWGELRKWIRSRERVMEGAA